MSSKNASLADDFLLKTDLFQSFAMPETFEILLGSS